MTVSVDRITAIELRQYYLIRGCFVCVFLLFACVVFVLVLCVFITLYLYSVSAA